MRGHPDIAEKFKIEMFEARFCNCSNPILADPINAFDIRIAANMAGV